MENIVIVEEKKIEKQSDKVKGEQNQEHTTKGKQKLNEDDDVIEEDATEELETKGNKRKIKYKTKRKIMVVTKKSLKSKK